MKQTTGYTSSARYKCLEDLQKNSSGLCLTYCGWEYCDPGHRFGPNKRTSCVLHIVKEGKGILEMDKKKYDPVLFDKYVSNCFGFTIYENNTEEKKESKNIFKIIVNI